jgi:hypothetical protein
MVFLSLLLRDGGAGAEARWRAAKRRAGTFDEEVMQLL